MNSISSLQLSSLAQRYYIPDFQANDFECNLESEKLIKQIALYGEKEFINFLENQKDINHYFEDIASVAITNLITNKYYLVADFFVKKGGYINAYQLDDYLKNLPRERQIQWIQNTFPADQALVYCLKQNDAELFSIALNSFKKPYKFSRIFFDKGLEEPLQTAINLHQFEFLSILLEENPYPASERLLANRCSDEEAFLILKYISNPSKLAVEFLTQNGNFEPLEHLFNCHPHLKVTDNALMRAVQKEKISIFLLSKVSYISFSVAHYYCYEKCHSLIDYVIESNIPVEKNYPSLIESFLWMSNETTALHIINKFFDRLPSKTLNALVKKNYLLAVEEMFKKNPHLKITAKTWKQVSSDHMSAILLKHSSMVVNDEIISTFIKNKALKSLNFILKTYPSYPLQVSFLYDAIENKNIEATEILLERNLQVDEIALIKALKANEKVAELIIRHAAMHIPAFFKNFSLEAIPTSCSLEFFTFLIEKFDNVNIDFLLDNFRYMRDETIKDRCEILIKKGYIFSSQHIIKMGQQNHWKAFQLIMDHQKAIKIELKFIPEKKEAQQILISYLETGRIQWSLRSFSKFTEPDLFLASFSAYTSESWYSILRENSHYFMKAFNFINSHQESPTNPTACISEIISAAVKQKQDPIFYTLDLLVEVSSKRYCQRENIWKILCHLQSDKKIKELLKNCLHLKYYNPLDFNRPLFTSLYHHLDAKCRENEEDTRHLDIAVFKLSSLFSQESQALDYLEYYQKKHPLSRQPIHDACLFDIPRNGKWDKELWAKKVIEQKYSPKIMNLLPYAATIENAVYGILPSKRQSLADCGEDANENVIRKYYLKALSNINPSEWPNPRLPNKQKREKLWDYCERYCKSDIEAFKKQKEVSSSSTKNSGNKPFPELLQFMIRRRDIANLTKKQLQQIALNVIYQNVPNQHISFAKQCLAHGVTKKAFDEIIKYIEKPKNGDLLPDLVIENPDYPGYQLVKLSPQDPRLYILGKLTNCCQSVGDMGEEPTVHGGTSSFGSFYALIKESSLQEEEIIIAQSWAGITEEGEIVLDSIEHKSGFSSLIIERFFVQAAKEMIKKLPTIKRVVVGGGGTPVNFQRYPLLEGPYAKIIGYSSIGYDSTKHRYILAESTELLDTSKTNKNYVETNGIDIYVSYGKKVTGLALHALDRIHFWKKHRNTYQLLRKNELNPLVEEGHLGKKREHQGEFFFTAEALAKLVNHLLPHDSVIFNDNAPHLLPEQLKPLQVGESVSLALVRGVHASAVYIRNEEGRLKAFIMDSEKDALMNVKWIKVLESVYPRIKILSTQASLQLDYSSCGVFMLQALRYFAKEGERLFASIDYPSHLEKAGNHFYLKSAFIPPVLLKMAQCPILGQADSPHAIKLNEAALNAIVSPRKQLTLRDYIAKNTIQLGKKTYSVAAIHKSYKLFDLLESLLT